MAKKSKAKPEAISPSPKTILRWVLRIVPVAVLLILIVVALQRIEAFLIDDARFKLATAADYGGSSPGIRVRGAVNASEPRLLKVFDEDAGRSLYLFPAEERRRRLLAVDWVKDASVAKIWPNRVEVVIRERAPVAFVELVARDGRSRLALIDEDGVLLEQPEQSQYDLPILTGISPEQPEATRAGRVRLAMSMLRDLGPLAAQVSEIDVGDANNLRVTQSAAGSGVVVMMGREHFRSRLKNFLAHYPEIQRRLPEAKIFDLRIDDRITAVGEAGDGG